MTDFFQKENVLYFSSERSRKTLRGSYAMFIRLFSNIYFV